MENSFTKRFKDYSSFDLLKILTTPEDYDSQAVEAAQIEIDSRQISPLELEDITTRIQQDQAQKEQTEKQIFQWTKVFTQFKPIRRSDPIQDKIIVGITLLLLCKIVLSLIVSYATFYMYFKSGNFLTDLLFWYYLASNLFLPLVTFLFYKRKKAGWTLLTIEATYLSIESLIICLRPLFTSQTSPMIYDVHFTWILRGLIWPLVLWAMNRPSVLTAFQLSQAKARKILWITIGIFLLLLILLKYQL